MGPNSEKLRKDIQVEHMQNFIQKNMTWFYFNLSQVFRSLQWHIQDFIFLKKDSCLVTEAFIRGRDGG